MEIMTGNCRCLLSDDKEAEVLVLMITDENDPDPLKEIRRQTQEIPYSVIVMPVKDWNRDLSPWEAPAVFGSHSFGGKAEETLRYITDELMPEIEKILPAKNRKHLILGGYSLAGLFALWAAYQTDLFEAAAAVSPSVWFEGWDSFMRENRIRASYVYLSLGLKEEKTRNPIMKEVGNRIREQYDLLSKDEKCDCVLEWNPGGHFSDPEGRTGKGIAWCVRKTAGSM